MKAIFPGYYRPSEGETKSLWKTAIVILDTNILLNFYRYSEGVKKDFQKVLEKISTRLWVPYHAALEYQRNRLLVIADQNKQFDEVKGIIDVAQSTLSSKLDGLQLKKRHSSIDPGPFLAKVKDACGDFFVRLDEIRTNQLQVHEEDKIRMTLDGMLAEKIGPPPPDQKYLDELYREGEERFKALIPPGYMDKTKSGPGETSDFSCNGLNYKSQFGDLILWKQIISFAKDKKPDGIIFVTDDKKQDWWWEVEAGGRKTIGPRPELVDEIFRAAQTRFIMYSSESFMALSQEFLSVPVRQESIKQIRDVIEATKQPTGADNLEEALVEAVASWCKTAHMGEDFYFEAPIGDHVPDFIIRKSDASSVAFDVRLLREVPSLTMLENVFRRRKLWDEKITYNLALIAQPMISGDVLKLMAQRAVKYVSTNYDIGFDNIFLGYIGKPNIFSPRWKVSKEGLERLG